MIKRFNEVINIISDSSQSNDALNKVQYEVNNVIHNTLEDSKYNVNYVGDSKKYETVPCRLRLTSKRSVKWGLELIALMAEKEGLELNPKYVPTSYVPANEPDEILLQKGLIKKVQ